MKILLPIGFLTTIIAMLIIGLGYGLFGLEMIMANGVNR
jgi:hypothetical protein